QNGGDAQWNQPHGSTDTARGPPVSAFGQLLNCQLLFASCSVEASLLLRVSSRPQRRVKTYRSKLYRAKWRDPEDAALAMEGQGVFPRMLALVAAGNG